MGLSSVHTRSTAIAVFVMANPMCSHATPAVSPTATCNRRCQRPAFERASTISSCVMQVELNATATPI
eukprot:12608755-Alexandrium_andersonii.AAC.1